MKSVLILPASVSQGRMLPEAGQVRASSPNSLFLPTSQQAKADFWVQPPSTKASAAGESEMSPRVPGVASS